MACFDLRLKTEHENTAKPVSEKGFFMAENTGTLYGI
jgi:hypothetical protein